MLYFAQVNHDVVIDQIPLSEIKAVKEMVVDDDAGNEDKKDMELMIETSADGYNSGRTYYLQAENQASRRDIMRKISHNSKKAFEKAHAHSSFSRAQRRVKRVYRSEVFQKFVAFLIVSVRLLCVFCKIKFTCVALTYERTPAELYRLRPGCSVQTR
jgi:hypothetical protein